MNHTATSPALPPPSRLLSSLWMLVRRETWENRISFIWTPVVFGAIILAMLVMGLIFIERFDTSHLGTMDAIRQFAGHSAADKTKALAMGLLAIQVPFNIVLFFVTVFYLLGALYDDRKDRSILFWKSLPVSDALTVGSKLAAAMIWLPLLFLAATAVTQLIVLLVAGGYALAAGAGVWSTVFGPTHLFTHWGLYLAALFLQALWLSPIFAWLLLVSSFAPRLPLLFAVGIPLVIGWVQSYLNILQRFDFKGDTVLTWIGGRLTEGVLPLTLRATIDGKEVMFGVPGSGESRPLEDVLLNFGYLADHFLNPQLWTGVLIAAMLTAAAIGFRRRATDQ